MPHTRALLSTLACTSPFVSADGAPLAEPERSVSLSAFHRTSKKHAVCASVDWPAKSATGEAKVHNSAGIIGMEAQVSTPELARAADTLAAGAAEGMYVFLLGDRRD